MNVAPDIIAWNSGYAAKERGEPFLGSRSLSWRMGWSACERDRSN